MKQRHFLNGLLGLVAAFALVQYFAAREPAYATEIQLCTGGANCNICNQSCNGSGESGCACHYVLFNGCISCDHG